MANYINNQEFHAALVERRETLNKIGEKPMVTNYLGKCIYDISFNLAKLYKFSGYSFKEDMIADGVETSLRYIDNFDPVKYKNPFAYFTQIAYNAFIQRIQKENKQSSIKGKLILNSTIDWSTLQDQDEDGTFINGAIDFLQQNGVYDSAVAKEEKRRLKARTRIKQATAVEEEE